MRPIRHALAEMNPSGPARPRVIVYRYLRPADTLEETLDAHDGMVYVQRGPDGLTRGIQVLSDDVEDVDPVTTRRG